MLSMLAIVCSGWGFLVFFCVLKSAKYVLFITLLGKVFFLALKNKYFIIKLIYIVLRIAILPRKMQNVYCRKKLSNIPYSDNVKKF